MTFIRDEETGKIIDPERNAIMESLGGTVLDIKILKSIGMAKFLVLLQGIRKCTGGKPKIFLWELSG
ncbi:MAG: hypothetical protein LRY76_07480 [Alphaproteobacteria bacterium]|nr:hypothetical protein [Alphaproteobacteria bacterium]MCD8526543.1 hypothetical protein [Alphaproteobacteria bacterium]MCD8571344.1 hypothetical protein [Alphaproteobacteria bacterium]